ncbi:MAG: MFS transporter [Erysipelotrichaceae bacterium]|nr:MFS transporter [Erysipelotrichaceae bacterium]
MKKESAKQLAKRKEREARQLARLQAENSSNHRLHSFWFLLVILTVVYIADEISSNMAGTMKPYMIFDLFNIPNADTKSAAYSSAISVMAIATIPTYLTLAINPLYKTLCDRYGRKIFLVINTLGTGVGMLISMIAPNPYIFVLGTCITGFFTPNDVQVIYLMETAPIHHRAKLCSITKGIGLLSVSLIGVFRSMFYDPAKLSTWRLVYLIPVLIAIAIGIFAMVFTRETPVFMEKRLKYLQQSDEERAAEEAKGEESSGGGIGEAFRYIRRSHQLKMLILVIFVFSVGVGLSGYSTEILLAAGHLSDADMNTFYILEPIVYAICAFFSGFATDTLGRKNSGMLFGILAAIGMATFVIGAKAGLSAVALALANGLMFGGMWSLSDLLFITLPGELAPTHIRASVMSLVSYAYISNLIVSMLVGIFYPAIGSANIGIFQLCLFAPIMIFSVVILKLKIKETKDTDLTQVTLD